MSDGKAHYLDDHIDRIVKHAHHFSFMKPSRSFLHNFISDNCQSYQKAKTRIIVGTNGFAIEFEKYTPPPNIYEGVGVYYTDVTVHKDLAPFKTSNTMPYRLAQLEAQRNNMFEGLLIDHAGYVVDGSRTGFVVLDNKQIIVPKGGLASIMRQKVVAHCRTMNLAVKSCYLKKNDICGQMLLMNCLMGVVPVSPPQTKISQHLVETFKTR